MTVFDGAEKNGGEDAAGLSSAVRLRLQQMFGDISA